MGLISLAKHFKFGVIFMTGMFLNLHLCCEILPGPVSGAPAMTKDEAK
jgi:hypothetical protein